MRQNNTVKLNWQSVLVLTGILLHSEQLAGSDLVFKEVRINCIPFRFSLFFPQKVLPFIQPTWTVDAEKGLRLLA